ncbi:MAG TPA: carboxymuconolactone decarboxylase family protein [Mucilaginibacter sp.]|jgi:AhpD family alkylhydroperoxidase|nr:carboxymuconolactone decarboxylase family protein [Mucilaginibacter sp.]
MSKRINILQLEPDGYKAMGQFENYMANSGINKIHWELIKIRASQINGCAYCLDQHSREARNHGETEQRIYVLSAWRETSFFSEEEKAILAITEEITLINNGGVTDQTYEHAATVLGEPYLAKVIMAITLINAWNRIGVSTHMQPKLVVA